MKKIFLLCFLASASLAFAQSPTIDGVYSPTEGWGAIRGTGTQVGASNGWFSSDAQELYVTYDATYVYFGAKCKAASWMQFIFVVNTKAGGTNTDPWGRQITYNQTNRPDFLFRGDIAGSNYAQFQSWDGAIWTGTSVNVNAAGTEVKGTFDGSDNGFIEIRVPKSLIGVATVADVQFIIGGNDGSHGIFDAIPNETNATSWSAPGNATTATSYVSGIALPIELTAFGVKNTAAGNLLHWATASEINSYTFDMERSLDGENFTPIGTVKAQGKAATYVFTDANLPLEAGGLYYRLKAMDTDQTFAYSKVVSVQVGKTKGLKVYPNPVANALTVEYTEGGLFQVINLLGQQVLTGKTPSGGRGLDVSALPQGTYFLKVGAEQAKFIKQ